MLKTTHPLDNDDDDDDDNDSNYEMLNVITKSPTVALLLGVTPSRN